MPGEDASVQDGSKTSNDASKMGSADAREEDSAENDAGPKTPITGLIDM